MHPIYCDIDQVRGDKINFLLLDRCFIMLKRMPNKLESLTFKSNDLIVLMTMLLRTAEELLFIEYEILLVVLVVKFLAYLCIKHAR